MNPDGKAEIRAITTGDIYGRMIVVTQGLKAGEKVIGDGFQSVRQGIAVSAKPYTESPKTEGTQGASEQHPSDQAPGNYLLKRNGWRINIITIGTPGAPSLVQQERQFRIEKLIPEE